MVGPENSCTRTASVVVVTTSAGEGDEEPIQFGRYRRLDFTLLDKLSQFGTKFIDEFGLLLAPLCQRRFQHVGEFFSACAHQLRIAIHLFEERREVLGDRETGNDLSHRRLRR